MSIYRCAKCQTPLPLVHNPHMGYCPKCHCLQDIITEKKEETTNAD